MSCSMLASSSVATRPGLAGRCSPSLAARPHRCTVVTRASSEKKAVNPTLLAAGVSSAALAVPQIASAAQEVASVAEGEPLIVTFTWAALAVMFSFTLSCVVWGRSGL